MSHADLDESRGVQHQLISDILPDLGESDIEIATSKESSSWATDSVKFYSNGSILARNHGISLQVVDEQTVRCLAVVNDERCLFMLSMVKFTFESVGIEFQIEPYAVLQSIPQRPEDAPPYLLQNGGEPPESEKSESKPPNHTDNTPNYEGMEVV